LYVLSKSVILYISLIINIKIPRGEYLKFKLYLKLEIDGETYLIKSKKIDKIFIEKGIIKVSFSYPLIRLGQGSRIKFSLYSKYFLELSNSSCINILIFENS